MRKRIDIQEWLALKPYDNQTMTDIFYLNLSNEVKQVITGNSESLTLHKHVDKSELSLLACFLTSYFEDIISRTNIWNSFIKVHHRWYQKQLPFYSLDSYQEGEMNVQDVQFLIWYFLNTIQTEKFIEPFCNFIFEIAEKVIGVFESHREEAPKNEHLKSYYKMDEEEDDFHFARNIIDTILFKTYLFHTDTLFKLKEDEFDIVQENKKDCNLMAFLNMNRNALLHGNKTRLLNVSGKEWAAEILGKTHSLSEDFLKISEKINGYFFYKGQDQKEIFIEHIASGKKFQVTKRSFEEFDNLEEIDTIVFMGIVKWKDEWWFSGTFFQTPFNADLVLDEKESEKSKSAVSFLDYKSDEIGAALNEKLQAFLDFNKGSQIAFLPAEEIKTFCDEYTNFFNKSINNRVEENETPKESNRRNQLCDEENKFNNLSEVAETGLVFFNPKSGIEIALGINSAFPLPNNPYFKEKDSDEQILNLLMNKNYSTELVRFCIDHCKNQLPFFKEGVGEKYLEDLDFLLRFWKSNKYKAQASAAYLTK